MLLFESLATETGGNPAAPKVFGALGILAAIVGAVGMYSVIGRIATFLASGAIVGLVMNGIVLALYRARAHRVADK